MIDGARTMTPPTDPAAPAARPGPRVHARASHARQRRRDASRPSPTRRRMRMLETMVTRQDAAWSVKELAAAIGRPADAAVPPHRAAGESRADPRRRAARGVRDHRDAVPGGGAIASSWTVACSPATRTRAARSSTAPWSPCSTRRATRSRRLSPSAPPTCPPTRRSPAGCSCPAAPSGCRPARHAELRRRLAELEAEFDHEDRPDAELYGVVIALYPMPPLREADDD